MTGQSITIFWFRRDLRLHDNPGLKAALQSGSPVLPVFIFDKNILDKLEDKDDRRVEFIHNTVASLKHELRAIESDILVVHDDPHKAWGKILEDYQIKKVFANHDYEPYAIERDSQIKALLASKGVEFNTFKDHCIFEKRDILSNGGQVYTVFTPYSRKWKSTLTSTTLESHHTEPFFGAFQKTFKFEFPNLNDIGFVRTGSTFPPKVASDDLIRRYHESRNIPAIPGTTKLSVHLRFGTVSIRELVTKALSLNGTWLNELIWRDFYMMILSNFPHVASGAFRKAYDRVEWRNDEKEFEAWCAGNTGYPIVDAGMRELNRTGFMHNRVRMITASFLTKHLLIDWRWGEAYFAKKLLDFDLAANNGGWQWAAGSGTDAAPYFRVFNPYEQTKKFDPELKYIKKWVPEFQEFNYPKPIVEHAFARNRCLEVYKRSLKG